MLLEPGLFHNFFTVFSGAGYGLLVIVGLTTLTSLLPDSTMLNLIMLILSLLLISVGLLFLLLIWDILRGHGGLCRNGKHLVI